MENAVAELREMIDASEDALRSARLLSERDRDYVDGKQLTDAEIATLKKRGQAPAVFNRIRPKIEWLQGLEIKQRTDPRAFPRTPDHEEGAEAATDAIRFVCDNADWDQVRSEAYSEMLVEGFAGCEVTHKTNARGDVEIELTHTPWDRLFYDPYSRKSDFSDARYKGTIIWTDARLLREEYPDQAGQIDALMGESVGSETTDDRPKHNMWADSARKRIKVCIIWHRKGGQWHWCKLVKDIKLDGGLSPYRDEHGETVCPLIMQSAYVDRDNARYGIVRDLIDIQDEINKRRSKALHHFITRQVVLTKGVVSSVADVRKEMARPDGVIEIDNSDPADRFEIQSGSDLAAGQVALYQDAKGEIDQIGVSGDLTGEQGNSQSGRAILAKQQAGMIGISLMSDRLSIFTREVYRQIWMRVRQFWTEERWVRVTDNEANMKFVGLNQPVTLQQYLGQMPEEQAMDAAFKLGLTPGDPRLNDVVDVKNRVDQMDVDILIEEAPDRITLAGETFEAMLKYAQSGAIPPEVLIKADPTIPKNKKDELLEALEAASQRQSQTSQPMIELEMADKQADIALKTAKAQSESASQTAAGY